MAWKGLFGEQPTQDPKWGEIFGEQLVKDAECVAEEFGMDLTTVFRMVLRRMVREADISFLLASKTAEPPKVTPVQETNHYYDIPAPQMEMSDSNMNKMTKNRAIALFRANGFSMNGVITFASKNRSSEAYWANPYFSVLTKNWFLILNDWKNRKLYLFAIPSCTFNKSMVIARSDKPEFIDLQIMYNDTSFTDMRSRISFAPYMKRMLTY